MNCDKIIEKFLLLDDYKSLSVKIQIHMFFCPACRNEIKFLINALDSCRQSAFFYMEKDLTDVIMARIFQENYLIKNRVSSLNWFAIWIIILASILLLPFNEQFVWLIKYFGNNLEVPIVVVLGLLITIYSTCYIGTHLENFKKLHEFLKKKF